MINKGLITLRLISLLKCDAAVTITVTDAYNRIIILTITDSSAADGPNVTFELQMFQLPAWPSAGRIELQTFNKNKHCHHSAWMKRCAVVTNGRPQQLECSV